MSSLYFDPVTGDPPQVDAAFPPSYHGLAIPSGGDSLYGVAYSAQGRGPHPVAVFLHGFPGHERNVDLAQAARRAGWTSVLFGHRGAWGSGGQFTFTHVLEDVRAALDWLGTAEARDAIRADGERVALVGLSMGGWSALLTAADTPSLLGAAALAPWNLGAHARLAADPDVGPAAFDFMDSLSQPLNSPGADALLAEAIAHADAWDYTARAADLRGRRLLLVAGAEDDEVPAPIHFAPLVAAVRGAAHVQHHTIAHADHAFSTRRIELTRLVTGWLNELRRG